MQSHNLILFIVLGFAGAALVAVLWRKKPLIEPTESKFFESKPDPIEPVDPWVMQRALMLASDQEAPTIPMVTKTALLYYALILEEAAELGEPLHDIMALHINGSNVDRMIANQIAAVVSDMEAAQTAIKELLKGMPDFSIRPTREQIKLILDGTTDIQVVNSGFSIAAGLLGDTAYQRTQTSNLSKINPATGKIDKDASGKWIKGVNYKMPFFEDLIG